jgi:dolichol-phosphate mannosyltransferase
MNSTAETQTIPEAIPPHKLEPLPATYGERINVATAMAAVCDALIFLTATAGGLRLGPAQILSFAVATAINYELNIRAAVRAAGRARDWRLYSHLVVVSLLALFLRGGVLALLTRSWGWPLPVAICIAIATTLAVTLPGNAFSLSTLSAWRLSGAARWRLLAIGLIVYTVVLRLIYLGQVELLPEEAYYWNYSQHLDIGYLDHPPMIAWLIRLSSAAFGATEIGVRAGALLCSAITGFFIYRLTRNLFDASTALVALVLSQVLPFFFAAGIVVTPDTLLVAAWAAELYFLERALVGGRTGAWWGAGLWMGIGLLSKYSIGLLAPAALLFVALDPQSRQWLRRWQPYAAAVLALAMFAPVIAWNAQNEWASFAFQTTRRLAGEHHFALYKLIGAAIVLLTPTGVFAAAAPLLGRPLGSSGQVGTARKWRFMQLTVGVPLAVFVAVSLRYDVKFDWTSELWLATLPAMAYAMTDLGVGRPHGLAAKIRNAWMPTILGLLVLYAAGLYFLVVGLPGLGYSERMEVMPLGWREFGEQVNTIAQDIGKGGGGAPLIVGMDRYAIASEVAFYATAGDSTLVRETSGAHLFERTALMYSRWVPTRLQEGRTLLLVAWDRQDLNNPCVESRAQQLGPLQSGVLMRDSRVVRRYFYRMAYGYRSSPTCK